MIVYKAFRPGLVCLGYQFQMGLNTTDKANCAQNGFHCAENPLDCLCYYPSIRNSEYYIVDARGDIDEDGTDTRIACTELNILKQITVQQLLLLGLAYMVDHPTMKWSTCASKDRAVAHSGYVIVRGADPLACGKLGSYLAFAKENPETSKIEKIAVVMVDGDKILPNVWYDIRLTERQVQD